MSQNSEKFPLLRLPTLAAELLIRAMEVKEMFILSLLSTRARNLLNYSLPKNRAHVKCSLFGHKQFDIQFSHGSNSEDILRLYHVQQQYHVARTGSYNSYKIHDILCKFFLPKREPIKIISDKQLEVVVEAFLTHLAGSFQTPKITMEFGSVMAPRAALGLLNYAKSLNLPMGNLKLETTNTPDEVYRAFLNNGPIARELVIRSEATPAFQYSPSEVFKLDRFHVSNGHWVQLQDFMECRSVVVRNMTANRNMYSVNAQRLNEFFKAWQRSSCRLESLEVSVYYSQELNFEEIAMGLNGTNYVRTGFFQSLDIERKDGRKARIQLTQMDLTLEKRN